MAREGIPVASGAPRALAEKPKNLYFAQCPFKGPRLDDIDCHPDIVSPCGRGADTFDVGDMIVCIWARDRYEAFCRGPEPASSWGEPSWGAAAHSEGFPPIRLPGLWDGAHDRILALKFWSRTEKGH